MMSIIRFLRALRTRLSPRRPLVVVGISKANLLHNLHTYQARYPGIGIAPVLKSNAYGHDLGLIARLLDTETISFFMVDSLYEARRLRAAGVRSRIVVMGYVRPEDPGHVRLQDIDYAITDIEQLRELVQVLHRPARFHIKIDTGMHRQGILPEDVTEAITLIQSNPHLHIVGIASHFADADGADETFTRTQLARWHDAAALLTSAFPSITYRHIAATKGVRFAQDAKTNVVRVGIGLYGFDTARTHETTVKPVLELRSSIASLRTIPVGEHVGYNASYTARGETRIATVPLGYYEGVDRRLSGQGSMRVRDHDCPIAGRVSMNMSTLDVTAVPSAARGDTVIALSRDPHAPNSVAHVAELCATIPYEILVHIPQHLRRVVE